MSMSLSLSTKIWADENSRNVATSCVPQTLAGMATGSREAKNEDIKKK